MVSLTPADWAEQHHLMLEFITPGRPMQNGFIERFNRSYREAVLDMFVFQSLSEVREQAALWLKEYNEERPHKSLGHLTTRRYLLTQKPEISSNSWSVIAGGLQCNCQETGDFVDYHLWIVKRVGDLKAKSIVIEMTPRVRQKFPGWTIKNLNYIGVRRLPVRVSG